MPIPTEQDDVDEAVNPDHMIAYTYTPGAPQDA